MTKKQHEEIIKAIICGSGLDPNFEDDYYGCCMGDQISNFMEGICSYFEIPRDSWVCHFSNLGCMDSPSITLKHFSQSVIKSL